MANFYTLARLLQGDGYKTVLIGGPRDVRALAELRSKPGIVDCVGKISLENLPNVFKKSSLVIVVDTGTLHMAASLDVTTIGLYGPTILGYWGICGASVCHVKRESIADVSVEEVWAIAQNKLNMSL